MDPHPAVILALALLSTFLIGITVLKYSVRDDFTRTRLIMSGLFFFIVTTLTFSYWRYVIMTLPYVVPAFFMGIILGYAIGVRTDRQKLMMHGLEGYMERFARIEHHDFKNLTWWSFVNFYSIMAALVLINLIGLTNVILDASPKLIATTSAVGAAFIGSIVPYLIHLWTVPYVHKRLMQKK